MVVLMGSLVLALVLGIAPQQGVVPASEETYSLTCYCSSDDADGDGYAKSGASPTVFELPKDQRLTCPSGYVPGVDDCDDSDATVHPRREERGPNGKDDNCNGCTDEPQLLYPDDASGCTTSGFPIRLKINSQEVLDARSSLWASVSHAKLADADNLLQTNQTKVNLTESNGRYYAYLTLTGLDETSVYRCQVTFYRLSFTGGRAGGRASRRRFSFSQVGEPSGWYYATTTGTEDKSIVRTNIVMRALRQYNDSSLGKIGRLGGVSPNGVRFGAGLNDYWCSEFYVWCAEPWLEGISGLTTVAGLEDYFDDYDGLLAEADMDEADRGDYLGCGSGHSGMFLALDQKGSNSPADWDLWTVEGNVGNQVMVLRREMSDYTFSIGHIMQAQLK